MAGQARVADRFRSQGDVIARGGEVVDLGCDEREGPAATPTPPAMLTR